MISFDTKTTSSKKIFRVKFPHRAVFGLRWNEASLKELHKLESSDKVSDQIKMLAMIAEKMEREGSDYNVTREV